MLTRLTPPTVISLAALFFALGGSALAVSQAVKPQARCANGAVRGLAAVTGPGGAGVANIPDQFSAAKGLFSRTFNCAGGSVEVRRIQLGIYEVRFPGNAASSALVSAAGAETWVTPMPGNVFRIGMHVPGRDDAMEAPFLVVAV
jgi:hypothetical protein